MLSYLGELCCDSIDKKIDFVVLSVSVRVL